MIHHALDETQALVRAIVRGQGERGAHRQLVGELYRLGYSLPTAERMAELAARAARMALEEFKGAR